MGSRRLIDELEQTSDQVRGLMEQINMDMEKVSRTGNKAAARRVRKASLDLEKTMKVWRKLSPK